MLLHLFHLHTYTNPIGLAAMAIVAAGVLATRGGRPVAKRAIVATLTATETVRGWVAEAAEQAQDLYAESVAELHDSETAAEGTSKTRP